MQGTGRADPPPTGIVAVIVLWDPSDSLEVLRVLHRATIRLEHVYLQGKGL